MNDTAIERPFEREWSNAGFSVWPMKGPFVAGFAKVWFKTANGAHTFRVVISKGHLNGFGVAHGGFLSTLADIWLGYCVAAQLPASARFVTSSLTVDFLRPVGEGAWLESHIDRIRLGRHVCHASGALLVESEAVAAARASFAVLSLGARRITARTRFDEGRFDVARTSEVL